MKLRFDPTKPTQLTGPTVPTLRRLIAGLLSLSLAATPIAALPADLNTEMQSMFNDLGALGNVTTPGAFRGQAMNLDSSVSRSVRRPEPSWIRSGRPIFDSR